MTLPQVSDSKFIFDTSLGTLVSCHSINGTSNSLHNKSENTSDFQNNSQPNRESDYTTLPQKYFQNNSENVSVVNYAQYGSFCNLCKYKFFICNFCLKCFVDKSKLDKHKRNTHDKHLLDKYVCVFCNTTQCDKKSFIKHIRLHLCTISEV